MQGDGQAKLLGNIQRFRPAAVYAAGLAIFILAGAAASRAQDAELTRKLTLKEAVNLAVANSRDLALARLQYGVMQRQIGVARSAFLPNLYTGTGVAYTSGFPLLEGGGAPAIFTLSYTQQIFNPPLKGEQRAAEQRAEEQRLSMDGVRDTVMSRAALDYLELAKVRHALELMRSERTSAGRILEATRERADAGRELPIEVIRAQLTTARIEQRIAQLEDRDDSLSGELRDMMGLPPDEMIEVSTEEIPGAAAEASKDLVSRSHGQQRGAETGGNRVARARIQTERRTGRALAVVRPDRPVQRAEQDQQLHRFFQQVSAQQRHFRRRRCKSRFLLRALLPPSRLRRRI